MRTCMGSLLSGQASVLSSVHGRTGSSSPHAFVTTRRSRIIRSPQRSSPPHHHQHGESNENTSQRNRRHARDGHPRQRCAVLLPEGKQLQEWQNGFLYIAGDRGLKDWQIDRPGDYESLGLLFPFPIVFLSFLCYNVQDIFKKME